MGKITIDNIGPFLSKQRGDKGIREVAKEMKISPATLSRVERGGSPDISTFQKICAWLKIDPGEVLGYTGDKETSNNDGVLLAHLKADRILDDTTAKALGEAIIVAQKLFQGA